MLRGIGKPYVKSLYSLSDLPPEPPLWVKLGSQNSQFVFLPYISFILVFRALEYIKGESFRPGMKISSNYKVHTFEVFIYKYKQTPQLTGI